jgi:hypothetical protein
MLFRNADFLTELREKFINAKALRIQVQIRYCSIVEPDLSHHGQNP